MQRAQRDQRSVREGFEERKETTNVLVEAMSSIIFAVGVGNGKHTIREGIRGEGRAELEFEDQRLQDRNSQQDKEKA